MEGIMKIVKYFKEFGLLIKRVSNTSENETKKQTTRFFSMLLGTLGASLLGNMLPDKGVVRAGDGLR